MGENAGRRRGRRAGRTGVGALTGLLALGLLVQPGPGSAQVAAATGSTTVVATLDDALKGWTGGARTALSVVGTSSRPVARAVRTSGRGSVVADTPRTTVGPGSEVTVSARLRSNLRRGTLVLRIYETTPSGQVVQKRVATSRAARTGYLTFQTRLRTGSEQSSVFVRMALTGARSGQRLYVKDLSATAQTPAPAAPAAEPSAQPSPAPSPDPPVESGACRDRDYRDPAVGRLSFADEFSGSAVDTTKWRVRDRDHLSFDAAYLKKENVTVADGMLRIAGRRMSDPVIVKTGLAERWWSTGYLDTIGTFSQKYGRWEMRAKVPTDGTRTRGVWPAFWLRGDTTAGEIDVMETYGAPSSQTRWDPSNTYEATIWRDTNVGGADRWHQRSHAFNHSPAIYEDFHVYGVNWSPECLTFTYDDAVIGHVAVKDVPWMAAALDSRFNIRLNMQVGSSYWGMPTEQDTKPAFDFVIDYVRAYEPVG